jgi:peptidoglycan/xylan/chitin deacetylase (PgdA/CDA1 family)
MQYLHRHHYSVIPLAQLVRSLRGHDALPKKAVVVTFDDGSSCIYGQAMPILAKHGFPATVFMISGLVDGSNEWLRGAGFPERRMLSVAELRTLSAEGIEVGSHTVTHPWLSRIALERARAEVRDSKAQLEDLLGRQIEHFAYPYGDYSEAVREGVEEAGYSAACSTRWGKRHTEADLYDLRRVEITGRDSLLQFALKLRVATHNMPPVPETRHLLRRGLEGIGILAKRGASIR